MTGLGIDPARVTAAADGIATTIADMGTIGIDRIVGPSDQYGHDGLHAAFDGFCGGWQRGVTALLDDADTLSAGLAAAVESYRRTDESFSAGLGGGR